MRQGEVYWLRFGGTGSEPAGRRPAVVVQHDRFNRSAIQTTVVAAITSNLRLSAMLENVRLLQGLSLVLGLDVLADHGSGVPERAPFHSTEPGAKPLIIATRGAFSPRIACGRPGRDVSEPDEVHCELVQRALGVRLRVGVPLPPTRPLVLTPPCPCVRRSGAFFFPAIPGNKSRWGP